MKDNIVQKANKSFNQQLLNSRDMPKILKLQNKGNR
jgi:hypothetical protein